MIGGRDFRRDTTAALFAVAIILAASGARAGTWQTAKDGCQLWNPNPQLDEAVIWSGACANGHAEGTGTAKWMKSNDTLETDEGEWRDGRQSGRHSCPVALSTRRSGSRGNG